MSNFGKEFEDKVYRSFQEQGVHIERIKTRRTQYKGDTETGDFYTYGNSILCFIEAKSTSNTSLPLSMIRPHQAKGLWDRSKFEGIYGGILVEMRKYGRVFYVPIEKIEETIQSNKASVSIKELETTVEIRNGKLLEVSDFHERVKGWDDERIRKSVKR